ncbi:hypothetical protein U9M48_030328 [Paspalum notatum var. saurae]|uniref:Uncharacterized protein n=1 Tax=Paspalum notatum var. saurae TaxID=547442 RepID=A0AAQ3X3M8_PASNO
MTAGDVVAAGAKPATTVFLIIRRMEASLYAALAGLRQRYHVLDFFASTDSLPAFLSSAAAAVASGAASPPRAAVVGGAGPARVDAAFLDAFPSVRCVISLAAGVDFIDLDECARRGVVVANSGRVYSADVADHAVGLLLQVLRRVSAADRFVRRGLWPSAVAREAAGAAAGEYYPLGTKLGGKRVGVVGLGNIGSLIAKRLVALGCLVSYTSRRARGDAEVPYKYYPSVRDLAADADVLVVACALTKDTRRCVDRAVMDALGAGGVIVNISRGGNVDQAELVDALREGRIAGAGLDVFESEPNVPPELCDMDNVVMTTHAGAFTNESMVDVGDLTVANLEAFFAGKPVHTPVQLPQAVKKAVVVP